jgi:hypothetical protein
VLAAIAPVDNPIWDGAGGVIAVTTYQEGGFVGSVALVTRASADGLEIAVTLEEQPAPSGGPTVSGPSVSPGTAFWTATASMVTPRSDHTATLLRNGKVLVAGGIVFYGSALLWSPDHKRLLLSSIDGVVSVAVAPGSPNIVYASGNRSGGLNLEWSASAVTWQPVLK